MQSHLRSLLPTSWGRVLEKLIMVVWVTGVPHHLWNFKIQCFVSTTIYFLLLSWLSIKKRDWVGRLDLFDIS